MLATLDVVRLLLIRHGQTPANLIRSLDTAAPGPGLTDFGQRQAEAVPATLAGEDIAAIYVSTLARTHLTAAPLAAAHGLEPVELPGIHEIEAGDLEKLSDMDSIRRYLGTVVRWGSGEPDLRMPGAFTGTDFMRRFDDSIARVQAEHPDGTVAVFSHGAAMRLWVRMRVRDIDPDFTVYADLDNTGMAIMEGVLHPDGRPGFELIEWRGAAAGLDDVTAEDVTGEPVAEVVAEKD